MDQLIELSLYIIAFFTGALLALFFVLICDYKDLRHDLQQNNGSGTASNL